MAFNNRPPSPLDPDADPNLPIADSAQAHDIPTGVAPSLAKLQDWVAWLRDNGVFYDSPGTVANDITIDGELTVTENINAEGSVIVDEFLVLAGTAPTVTSDPGTNVFHSAHIPKSYGRIITNGGGGYTIPSSGVNLGLATLASTYADVDFVRAFSDNEYAPVVTNISGTSDVASIDYANSTSSKVRLVMRTVAGVLRNPLTEVCAWSLHVMGRHA